MDGFIFLNSSLAGTSPSDKGTVHSVCGPFTPLWSVGCVLNDHLMDIFLWPNIISVNRQPLASLPRTSYICCFICWGRALGEERAAAAWWKYRPWTRSLIVNGVLMSWGLNKSQVDSGLSFDGISAPGWLLFRWTSFLSPPLSSWVSLHKNITSCAAETSSEQTYSWRSHHILQIPIVSYPSALFS